MTGTGIAESLPFCTLSQFLRWSFDNPADERVGKALAKYYANYHAIRHQQADYIWRLIDRRAAPLTEAGQQGARVLEVGCGIGTNSLWAAVNGANTTGLEVKKSDANVAIQRKEHLEEVLKRPLAAAFHYVNFLDFVDDEGFDLVFLQEAFHHLEPREDVVRKLSSLVRPGGLLVMQETNALNPLIQASLFRHRGFRTVIQKRDPVTGEDYIYGNERILTSHHLTRLFHPYGFSARTQHFRLLPTRLAMNPVLTRIATRLEDLAEDSVWLRPACVFYQWSGRRG